MGRFQYKEFYERNLPHMQPPQATLFVTFRLDGSLPKTVLDKWRIEKKRLEETLLRRKGASGPRITSDPEALAEEKVQFRRRWFRKFEALLDGAATGPLWLKEDAVAEIVAEALHHRDGSVYRLDAYCVMPNHVHTVFAPLLTESMARDLVDKAVRRRQNVLTQSISGDETQEQCRFMLASIMESLKGWTARRCNKVLNRQGQFWQHESYDHVIRSRSDWERIVNYVVNNPVKAGMVSEWQDWKWSYRRV